MKNELRVGSLMRDAVYVNPLTIMRKLGEIARKKKLPCVITPSEVRGAEQLPLRFQIRHGAPPSTTFVTNLRRKKTA